VHVHPDILRKPGPLTTGEWVKVKRHTIYGVRILGDHPRLAMAREVALNHHEHWDGTGYPQGLAETDIPLSGRICMMADVYDALRSVRPYKPPYGHEQALEIIRNGDLRLKPQWFDPQVLQAFLDIHADFAKIYRESKD
jgi:HD-GYP domain-containing protein (c-di-GMP phosphodiesterase class II)